MYAYWIAVNYRESYGMYTCNGILFNHESLHDVEKPLSHVKLLEDFLNIALGLEKCIYMGNIDSLRDWGHAKDYVKMQWMMLQQDVPEDFVIATGMQYSVREFIQWAGREIGLTIDFSGKGIDEVERFRQSKAILPQLFRWAM